MNKEQLQEEFNKTLPEYTIAQANFRRLEKKLELLEKALCSMQDYESASCVNFEELNTLTRFLKSDLVTLDPKLYCRQKVFVAAFNDYCKENYFSSSKWTNQFYAGPFADFGLKTLSNARKDTQM